MNDLAVLFGRLHPLVLHAPIGAFAALLTLEALNALFGKQLPGRRSLAAFAAVTGVLSAGTGWWLAKEGYGGEVLYRHRWSGVSFSVLLCVVALVARPERTRLYLGALALAAVGAGLAGHFGATITHGPGYFRLDDPGPPPAPEAGTDAGADAQEAAEGSEAGDPGPGTPVEEDVPVDAAPAGPSWSSASAILSTYCVGCHGPTKQKARLALHNPVVAAAGGFTGPVIVPGDAEGSELLRRMRLDLEDEEHMPPTNKPQPTAEEYALLEAWIEGGAAGLLPDSPGTPAEPGGPGGSSGGSPGGSPAGDAQPAPAALDEEQARAAGSSPTPVAVDSAALGRLADEHLHAELFPADGEAHGLWVDCSPRRDLAPAELLALLAPLRPALVELSLAGTRVGDEHLAELLPLPRLERLNLRDTAVTDAGLAPLAGHVRLVQLNLAGTGVAGFGTLEQLALELPELTRVLLHGAPAAALEPPDAVAGLLVAGEPNAALEQEPAPVFGDPDSGHDPAAVGPSNSTCPVTGSEVDGRYTLVWEDERIGFCCSKCPETFRADPGRYLD